MGLEECLYLPPASIQILDLASMKSQSKPAASGQVSQFVQHKHGGLYLGLKRNHLENATSQDKESDLSAVITLAY